MAKPGQNTKDLPPLRVTKAGAEAVDEEAGVQGVEKQTVMRQALTEYFERKGKKVQFTPDKPEASEERQMNEQQAIQRVLDRVQALGLPKPRSEHRVNRKVYDLAWPDKQKAIEVSMRPRPADKTGWTVGSIRPGMTDAQIDKVLTGLAL